MEVGYLGTWGLELPTPNPEHTTSPLYPQPSNKPHPPHIAPTQSPDHTEPNGTYEVSQSMTHRKITSTCNGICIKNTTPSIECPPVHQSKPIKH